VSIRLRVAVVFTLALAIVQLEYEHGIPRNPCINAGALVVTDRLLSLTGDACGAVERFLQTECACPEVASDQVVASSEAGTASAATARGSCREATPSASTRSC